MYMYVVIYTMYKLILTNYCIQIVLLLVTSNEYIIVYRCTCIHMLINLPLPHSTCQCMGDYRYTSHSHTHHDRHRFPHSEREIEGEGGRRERERGGGEGGEGGGGGGERERESLHSVYMLGCLFNKKMRANNSGET